MTNPRRARLAREARKLAMECVEGTAPEFYRGFYFGPDGQRCAVAEVAVRAGVVPDANNRNATINAAMGRNDNLYSNEQPESWEMAKAVADANNEPFEQHTHLILPLLALADALEET